MMESNRQLDAGAGSSNRNFGLVMAAFFALVAFFPYFSGGGVRVPSLVVAAVFLVLALVLPSSLTLANRLWTKFGLLLHKIISPLAMGCVFFLVVMPTALFMRMFGKPPLILGYDNDKQSYWIKREQRNTDMTKQF